MTAPAFGTVPDPSCGSYGPRLAAFADVLGVGLFPWQRTVADEWLEVDAADRLARGTATLVVGRRNGKSLLIALRALFGMLYLGERRVTYTAHLFPTAEEVMGLVVDLCAHPSIAPRVAKVARSHGQERVELTTAAGPAR